MTMLDNIMGQHKPSPNQAILQLTDLGKKAAESQRGQGMLGNILDTVEDDGPCTVQHTANKTGIPIKDILATCSANRAYINMRSGS